MSASSKDIPIIFSAPMVRALLDGPKTMTRRILKPQPEQARDRDGNLLPHSIFQVGDERPRIAIGRVITTQAVPYASGDRLWVKENYRTATSMDAKSMKDIAASVSDAGYQRPWAPLRYEADGLTHNWSAQEWGQFGRLRPSIHMPRWASRLTLIVMATKIGRLQDISEADAVREGVTWESADPPFWYVPHIMPHSITAVGVEDPGDKPHAVRCFAKLWDHVHGPGAWDANPEVVAITFRVIKANIDAAEAQP